MRAGGKIYDYQPVSRCISVPVWDRA